MTCSKCRLWVAKNWTMYRIRQDNMRAFPGIKPHACPDCGGTDWVSAAPDMPDGQTPSNIVFIGVVAAALLVAVVVMILALSVGRADPLPYPKPRNGQCGGGYVESGGFCNPKSGATVRDTIPKPPNGPCPSGWSSGAASCERMR